MRLHACWLPSASLLHVQYTIDILVVYRWVCKMRLGAGPHFDTPYSFSGFEGGIDEGRFLGGRVGRCRRVQRLAETACPCNVSHRRDLSHNNWLGSDKRPHSRSTMPTKSDPISAALASTRYLLNSGPVTIEPIVEFIRMPAGHEEYVVDFHGIARDSQGRIYVLYNSLQRFPHTRALARFHYVYDEASDKGRCVFDSFLGTRAWAEGTVHGLHIGRRTLPDGSLEECIVITNNDGTLILANIDGEEIWQRSLIGSGPTAPTAASMSRSGEVIGVVDGYGTSHNFLVRAADGEIFSTSGAKGSNDCQSFTNHGIDLCPDGSFVVADRGNRRLTWWNGETLEPISVNGQQRKLDLPGLEICGIAFFERFAVVPCLNSALTFLAADAADAPGWRLLGSVSMPKELRDAGIDGIHDAEFTADGRYIVIGVWERHRTLRRLPILIGFRVDCKSI